MGPPIDLLGWIKIGHKLLFIYLLDIIKVWEFKQEYQYT
jgi:hypothetical protein